MSKDDGGPVYPCKVREPVGYDPALMSPGMGGVYETVEVEYSGISRRDWLAGLAMQGMLSNPNIISLEYYMCLDAPEANIAHGLRVKAYYVADAMIEQGKK